ncbi:MAG: tyrosine-type recombinase/integrase [Oscillospiraceae bacterium]|nr:tyrosine-type recombinase/integrase [Oscillospiraceae bacterium]
MSKHGESIWKRKDGRWEARYIKDRQEDGKAIYGYLYAKTYKEVKEKRESLTKQRDESIEKAYKTTDSFDGVLSSFMRQQKHQVKESTYAHYCYLIESHIRPMFGNLAVNKMDGTRIERFIDDMLTAGRLDRKGGLSAKTVKDMTVLLKQIMRYAAEKNLISKNPVCFSSPKTIKRDIEVLTEPERTQLEAFSLSAQDTYCFGVYLCLYTGLRIGELCALRWSDIDLDNDMLAVSRTILRIKNTDENAKTKTKIIIDRPKTQASLRYIPLPRFIIREILVRKLNANNDAYILTGTTHYIEPRNYYERYKKYLNECHIRHYTFHALRHTFATRCIECGFDPKSLSEILGHSDVKITLERYVHPSMDLKRSHMERLAAVQ